MKLKDIPAAYRVAIKGLVHDEAGRLLFVRERGDAWDLPGGGLEHGEDALEALKREFLEELKVTIEIQRQDPLIVPTWNAKFDDPVLIIAYYVRLLSTPQATKDVRELRYLSEQEADALPLDSTLAMIVSQFYRA
ncbi:MAG: NUDIX hydrolase [Candidatus Saccharibacteria bacterium]|nr:NUDIX hydrolase [Candidatus Saccharibacteria bacterium]